MKIFERTRAAKEFLAEKIIAEAQRQGISLSEVEMKMLYFSESGWAPPDSLEVSEAFDRDYDREEYEQKIGAVVRSFLIYARDKDRSSLDRWKDAVRTLKAEDHYLLVLIDPSQNPQTATKSSLIKLFGMGLVLACLALEIIYVLVNR